MSEADKFDAIIVGAGPAGSACAYVLAREGKSVLLVERGDAPGSKNVTGGRLYSYALELVEEGLLERAALQRKVVREQIMMISGAGSALTIDYTDYSLSEGVPQSYTVLRGPFDEWFAAEAEGQGAIVACGILVDDLLEKEGKIVGIKAGEDELYADMVIAADGVNALLAQKAGLFGDLTADQVGVGVKEVIELPAEAIESRFNVSADEGVARLMLGCSGGIGGGGFLYTNKDSLSLGLVLSPEQLGRQERSIHALMQDLKLHPALQPLLAGGTTVEYGAHLVPELGWRKVPARLHRDGFMVIGDAAGLVLNLGITIRGIDLAIVSGVAAARALLKAEEPAQIGPFYREELELLGLVPTMKQYAKWPDILAMPRLYRQYPDLANELLNHVFTANGEVPEKMLKAMGGILKKHASWGQLLGDVWKGYRSL